MKSNSVKIHFNSEYKNKADIQSVNLIASEQLVFTIPTSAVNTNLRSNIEAEEVVKEIIPFFSLSIKNQSELFKVGKSLIKDITQGHKNFGFTSLYKECNEKHLLAYGSYINYTLKLPVLIVVKDLNDKKWDQYRENFTNGTLWKWNCCDWGALCFIDYNQVRNHSDSFNHVNFEVFTKGFSAILWSLPEGDLNDFIPQNAFRILEKINSITLVMRKGKTLIQNLKKVGAYYQRFGIPVKGVLTLEEPR